MSVTFCGGLNIISPHRFIGSGIIRRRGLGGSVSLGMGFEVLNARAQARSVVTLSSRGLQV